MTSRMREEPIRSLLLLDANPEERRLISAIAGRAGWSVVGAADEEMAMALLQGPHGREVLAALLGSDVYLGHGGHSSLKIASGRGTRPGCHGGPRTLANRTARARRLHNDMART